MDIETFRKNGKITIDYICNFYTTLPERQVYPSVKPGYLNERLPATAPEEPEEWATILKDTEDHIMIGITQWQHPQFFGYFPHGASFSSLLGDTISDAMAVVPFSWTSSPACSELEVIVMDWLCIALHLPKHFLSTSKGGGIIQTSASEAIYNCILAARRLGIIKVRNGDTESHDSVFLPELVAYCSDECHSCVEKGIKLALLRIRLLPTDENFSMRGETVENAFKEDIANGLTPIFLCSIFGSTSSTAMDRFDEIGPVCKKYGVWYHIDAAYAGFALICPELTEYVNGIEYADSINANAVKWFLIHIDCACLWVKDRETYCSSFIIDPLYLKAGQTNLTYDLRHWGIPLTRRFRSLKLWYTLRTYGLEKIRNYQRNHMKLAKYFESLLLKDGRFEISNKVIFGLVCFRLLNSSNETNQRLLTKLNETKEIHMVPTELKGKYVIRFCVTNEHATAKDIDTGYEKIKACTDKILLSPNVTKSGCPCKSPTTSGTSVKSTDEKEELAEEKRRMSFTVEVPQDIFNKLKEQAKLKDMVTFIVTPKQDGTTDNKSSIQIKK